MPRGALPSYTRLSHIPNLLEAYRYVTRMNLTSLASELQMSYHTVRRLCVDYSTPRESTLVALNKALPFIDQDTWQQWKLLGESALKAEQLEDIVELTQVEGKMRELIPKTEGTAPLHLIHECTIEAAAKLHTATLNNKTYSYYLSEVHNEALELLAIKQAVNKSELLRLFIDQALAKDPEVMEALVRSVTGAPAKMVEESPKPPVTQSDDIIEVTGPEEISKLAPHIPVDEIVTQLTIDLPQEVANSTPEVVEVETTQLLPEPTDYTVEDVQVVFEEWSPSATMNSESNLTEEEIARLFSGED